MNHEIGLFFISLPLVYILMRMLIGTTDEPKSGQAISWLIALSIALGVSLYF